MKKPSRTATATPAKLRARAESLLGTTRRDVAQMPVDDVQKLVHELQVHQIELEMQNDELRRTQLELETARDRYASLYDFAPVAHLTLNTHGEILEANLHAGELLGLERYRLIHQKFACFVPVDAQNTFYLLCQRVFSSDTRQSAELVLASTESKRLVVQVEAVRDATNPRKQCRVSFTDITGRKQIEAERHKFVSLAENSSDFIGMYDGDFKPFYANAAGLRLVGFADLAAACRAKVPDFFFPEDQPFITSDFFPRVLRDGHGEVEIRFRHFQTGAAIWMLYSVFNIRDASGTASGWATVSRDITDRKRAEAALRESEERLLTVAENLTEGLIITNSEGQFVHWNRASLKMHGFASMDECMGRLTEFTKLVEIAKLDGSPLPMDQWPMSRALRGELVRDCELRIRRTDTGVERILSYGGTAVRDEAGRQTAFLTITDITERTQAEQARRESEKRLHSILDNSPAMIFLKDAKGRYLHFNRKLAEVIHLSLEESVGKTDAELFPPDAAAMFRANDRKMLEAGVPMDFEEVTIRDDGSHTCMVTKFPLWDAQGKIYAIGGIATDITERKRMEETLLHSESDLTNFFNTAPIGMEWLSANGTIQRVNQSHLDMLDYARQEYEGRQIMEFHTHPGLTRTLLSRLAAKETVTNFRTQIRRKDGSLREVLLDATSLWEGNRFVHSFVFTRDISQRVELEREIMAVSEREQRRIAQDLHDGLGQLLAGTLHLTSDLCQQLAAQSRPEARPLRRIVKLLDEAMTQTRGLARGLHPVKAEPNGLMVALEDLAARTKNMFKVGCRFTCPHPVLIENNTMATHLYRIAQEAVTNAIKHGKPDRITIALMETPNRISVGVSDNGSGIPARRNNKGMGLHIMQHRAGTIGASLIIQKNPKGGTNVVCSVHELAADLRSNPAAATRKKD